MALKDIIGATVLGVAVSAYGCYVEPKCNTLEENVEVFCEKEIDHRIVQTIYDPIRNACTIYKKQSATTTSIYIDTGCDSKVNLYLIADNARIKIIYNRTDNEQAFEDGFDLEFKELKYKMFGTDEGFSPRKSKTRYFVR